MRTPNQAYNVCNSQWDSFDFATNWQSSRTAVATLPTYMSHTVAPGNATGLARNTLPYLQFVGYPCRNEPIAGQQPVTVKPKITSFRPNPLTVGVNPPNRQLPSTVQPSVLTRQSNYLPV